MTAQKNHSLPTSAERTQEGPRVARNGNGGLNTSIYELAESLRAMRRNARSAYVSARPGAHHSITMDSMRLGDLTDAADLIERQAAEIERLRALAEKLQAKKPVAWVRYASDGSIQGPLLDAQIEDVLRASWTPLISAEWVNRDAEQQKELS